MKRILLSTIVLTAFSLSIILFEMSCKKIAKADGPPYVLPIATTTTLGGVMPDGTTISVDATGKISVISTNTQQNKLVYIKIADPDANSIWTSNYDGTSPQKINITLPANTGIDDQGLSISPDHKTIFFALYPISNPNGTLTEDIYACNMDGTNLHKVITNSDTAIAY